MSTAQRVDIVAGPAAADTVLLVDDEDLVRSSTAEMLDDLGYVVVEASSAEAALQLIEGGLTPDLVLTDHLMPGMSGAELAGELHVRRPDLPVMILSGYARVDAIAPQLPRLAKPFLRNDLATAVAQLRAAARV